MATAAAATPPVIVPHSAFFAIVALLTLDPAGTVPTGGPIGPFRASVPTSASAAPVQARSAECSDCVKLARLSPIGDQASAAS